MFSALNRVGNLLQQFSGSVEITGISVAMTGTSLVKGKPKQHVDWPDVVFTKDNTVSVYVHHHSVRFPACRARAGHLQHTADWLTRCVTGGGAHRSPGVPRNISRGSAACPRGFAASTWVTSSIFPLNLCLLVMKEGTITWAKSAPTPTIKKHMAALAKLAVKLDIPLVRPAFPVPISFVIAEAIHLPHSTCERCIALLYMAEESIVSDTVDAIARRLR